MLKQMLAWGTIPVVAVILIVMEAPMAFGKEITLFSERTGRHVDENGTPQTGVRIERSWEYGEDRKLQSDQTVTGPDGMFHFSAVTQMSLWAAILPGTPVIKQRLVANSPDGPVEHVSREVGPRSEWRARRPSASARVPD